MDAIENLTHVLKDRLFYENQLKQQNQDINALFEANNYAKNHFYYENLTNSPFFSPDFSVDNCLCFYKRIAKSGVGVIIFDLKTDKNINDFCEIKKIIQKIHCYGSKVILKISSNDGKFNYYQEKKKVKYAANFSFDFNNKEFYYRASDGKIKKLVKKIDEIILQANKIGFDGVMIDAGYDNLIGELTLAEYNKRKLGYFSEPDDFLTQVLSKLTIKNENIILRLSLSSLFEETSSNISLCSGSDINFNKIFETLIKFVKLGIDGFEFIFGREENDFLMNFNSYQHEYLYNKFHQKIRELFSKKEIKNKFGNDVALFYHDNFNNFSTANNMVEKNIVQFIDVTRDILADSMFLKNLKHNNEYSKCIKCCYCDQQKKEGKLECLINPKITDYNQTVISSQARIIAVIGSGISGLVCSIELAKRGHIVHFFEKEKQINPIGKLYAAVDRSLDKYFSNTQKEVEQLVKNKKIILHLNEKFDKEFEVAQYDSIVVATGFHTKFLSIVGAVLPHVVNIFDAIKNIDKVDSRKNIVIYAKTMLSLKFAITLRNKYKNITIIIKNPKYFFNEENANLFYYFQILSNFHINILFFCRISKINEDNLEIINNLKSNGNALLIAYKIYKNKHLNFQAESSSIDCDYLIYEPDIYPNNSLYYELVKNKYKGELYLIGSALTNSSLEEQIASGYFVGKNI